MSSTVLFASGEHKNLLLPDYSEGQAVQANQHLIVDGGEAMLLDPGGHKVYNRVLSQSLSDIGRGKLKYLVLSHQDPDIVAAINGWLMTTNATAYAPSLWTRFIPHFGVDKLTAERLIGVPDQGMTLTVGATEVKILPGHFLHSPGNLHVYDPTSKIYYSGDLGASLGQTYNIVPDFSAHTQFMAGFHRRYMASNIAMRAWAKRARALDIETIAPQHGAIMSGKPMVDAFITWCEGLQCGVDLIEEFYNGAQPSNG